MILTGGKLKYWVNALSQCPFFQHKSHLGLKPGLLDATLG